MISSKEILEKTGISRATLNNYIKYGVLSRPELSNPGIPSGPRQLGYFPDDALDRVRQIQRMKQEGMSMAEIVSQLRAYAGDQLPVHSVPAMTEPKPMAAMPPTPSSGPLRVTLDDIPCPAYMVNHNLEVVWLNDEAREALFGGLDDLPARGDERNLFSLLANRVGLAGFRELVDFHLGLAKSRLAADAFGRLCQGLGVAEGIQLRQRFQDVEAVTARPVAETSLNLSEALGGPARAYASFYREGILIALSPDLSGSGSLLDLLARRDEVIRTLLRRRLPVLTPLAVLVADLQGSVNICSELPPEEYFELINEMWAAMGGIFRKYNGTYGKHVGDGMVYYFFPQPDSNYLMNALACSLEIRQEMQKLSKRWQLKKNWLNELYLNIGINEGQEWLGTFQTSTSVEFVVLGDTINQAARISDFARHAAVWATKSLVSKLPADDRAKLRYGVRRRGPDGQDVFVGSSFAMVSTLIDQDNPKSGKLKDIATLPIAEIVEISS